METFNKNSIGKIYDYQGKEYKCTAFASSPSVTVEEVGDENNRIDFCVGSPVSREFKPHKPNREKWIKYWSSKEKGCDIHLDQLDCEDLAELLKQK